MVSGKSKVVHGGRQTSRCPKWSSALRWFSRSLFAPATEHPSSSPLRSFGALLDDDDNHLDHSRTQYRMRTSRGIAESGSDLLRANWHLIFLTVLRHFNVQCQKCVQNSCGKLLLTAYVNVIRGNWSARRQPHAPAKVKLAVARKVGT